MKLLRALGATALLLLASLCHAASWFELDARWSADAALMASLREFLSAHQEVLPQSRYRLIHRLERDPSNGELRQVQHAFTPALAAFEAQCRTSPQCDMVVGRVRHDNRVQMQQLYARMLQLEGAPKQAAQLQMAVRGMVELSLVQHGRAAGVAMVAADLPMLRVATLAWLELGHAALGQALLEHLGAQAMLDHVAEPPQANFTLLQHGLIDEQVRDDLVGARRAWLGALKDRWVFTGGATSADQTKAREAVAIMARMAMTEVRLQRPQRSQRWAQALASLGPLAGIETAKQCPVIRLHAAQQLWSDDGDADHKVWRGAVSALRQGRCAVAEFALWQALHALQRGHGPLAVDAMQVVQEECRQPGECLPGHAPVVRALQAIVHQQTQEMAGLGRHWLHAFARIGPVGPLERAMVWALARSLLPHPAHSTLAHGLLAQLDAELDLMRERAHGIGGALLNLARYEPLKREALRARFMTTATVSVPEGDALRGQRVLYQLRRLRWVQEYGALDDDAGRQALAQARAQFAAQRRDARAADFGDSAHGLAVVREEILELMDDAEKDHVDAHYGRLALKKSGHREGVGLERHALRSADDLKALMGLFKLAADEAYLGWLKVPGGYLAALRSGAALSRDALAPDWGHVVADEPGLQETLGLFRELLQAGAGAMRGARLQGTAAGEPAGLQVRGLPVWRMRSGLFTASAMAPQGGQRAQRLDELAQALHQRLVAPLLPALQGVRRLVIAPDAELALLPFEALGTEAQPLVSRFELSYVQSLAVYAELQQRLRERPAQALVQALSLADPSFAAQPAVLPPPASAQRTPALAQWHHAQWASLPGTRRESDAVASLYPGTTRLLGPQASKASLQALHSKGELQRFGLLHFATHGYVDAQRSALVLASPQRSAEAYLFDDELAQLRLNSSLAILSACNSAVGRQVSGEGVVGLPYALFMAGNANTLMTLWAVDDDGTAEFVPAFLRRVRQGTDMVAALTQTKQAFARGEHGPRWRDPRIWAPFVLYGAALSP